MLRCLWTWHSAKKRRLRFIHCGEMVIVVHSVSGWTRGVQVKLWDPFRTRAIPERLRGVITTRRYTITNTLLYLAIVIVDKAYNSWEYKVCENNPFFCWCVNIGMPNEWTHKQWHKVSSFQVPKVMNIGERVTKLESILVNSLETVCMLAFNRPAITELDSLESRLSSDLSKLSLQRHRHSTVGL